MFSAICFLAGVACFYFYKQPVTLEKTSKEISVSLAQEIEYVKEEVSRFTKEWPNCHSGFKSEFPFYVFKNNKLVCWTDNKVLPPANRLLDTTSVELLKIAGSDFLLFQQPIDKDNQLVCLITLIRHYPIQNDYLTTEWNRKLFPFGNISISEPLSSTGIPIRFKGEVIFRINRISTTPSAHPTTALWCVVFITTSIIFFLAGFYLWMLTRYSHMKRTVFICLLLIITRVVLLFFSFPRTLFSGLLFSPQQFASSMLNPSLGDLWLNTFFLFLISLFLFTAKLKNSLTNNSSSIKTVSSILLCFLIFCIIHYPVLTFQTIAHNSNIDLDITSSLNFSWMRIVAISAILLTWCTSFLLLHVAGKFIFSKNVLQTYIFLLIGGVSFATLNIWQDQRFLPTLLITILLIHIIVYFQFITTLNRLQYKTFIYFFIVLFAFVLNVTVSIYFLNREKTLLINSGLLIVF